MGTFYAHDHTLVEVPLAALLVPGTYTVRLTLEDFEQGARAERMDLQFIVEAPSEGAGVVGEAAGFTDVLQDADHGLPAWLAALIATLAAATMLCWLVRRRQVLVRPPA
jgi:hypothetical protein